MVCSPKQFLNNLAATSNTYVVFQYWTLCCSCYSSCMYLPIQSHHNPQVCNRTAADVKYAAYQTSLEDAFLMWRTTSTHTSFQLINVTTDFSGITIWSTRYWFLTIGKIMSLVSFRNLELD